MSADDKATIQTKSRYDRIAPFYDGVEAILEQSAFHRWREKLWSEVLGKRILEVGVGTGKNLPYYPKGVQVTAIDLSERMLERAWAKGLDGNIDYICADVGRVPLPDEAVDSVVGYSCFPHFRDKPGALAEINRVLRRGGQLFICHTSSRASINRHHQCIAALANDTIPDGNDMRVMLLEAGFTGITIDDGENYLASARKPG